MPCASPFVLPVGDSSSVFTATGQGSQSRRASCRDPRETDPGQPSLHPRKSQLRSSSSTLDPFPSSSNVSCSFAAKLTSFSFRSAMVLAQPSSSNASASSTSANQEPSSTRRSSSLSLPLLAPSPGPQLGASSHTDSSTSTPRTTGSSPSRPGCTRSARKWQD